MSKPIPATPTLEGECDRCAKVKEIIKNGYQMRLPPIDIIAVLNGLLDIQLKTLPKPTLCSVCLEPQAATVHGDVCKNGHGGAPPVE